MYKRTTSAPTYGLKASTRGGIIPLSANKKIGKKKQNGNYMRQQRNSGKNFLFANGAHLGGQQETRNTKASQYPQFRMANPTENSISGMKSSNGQSLLPSNQINSLANAAENVSTPSSLSGRPPSASILHDKKVHDKNRNVVGGMSFEERQRVNSRRPNTAPTAPSPTKDENKDLRMENARLHQEMASMRDSFFRKMRGGKRFVSGGGFRTGGFPQNDPSEKKKNGQEKKFKKHNQSSSCRKKRLEEELSNAKLQIRRLNEQVRICQSSTKKLDDEVKRLTEIIKLKDSDIENFKTNLDETRNKAIKFENKCNEQVVEIQQLREALKSMENGQPSPIKIKEVVPDPETLNELVQLKEEMTRIKMQLKESLSTQEQMVVKLNDQIKLNENKDKKLKDLENIKRVLERQSKDMHETIEKQKSTIGAKEFRIKELIKWKTEYMTVMEDKEKQINTLNEALNRLKSEFNDYKEKSKGAHGSMQEALENEIARLKKQHEDVTMMLEKEKSERVKMKDAKEMAETRCRDFRKELETEKESHGKTKIALNAAQEEIDRLCSQLKDMQNELHNLQKQVSSNDSKNKDWIQKIEKMKELIQKLKDEVSDANRKHRNAESNFSREKVHHDATKRDLKDTIDEKKQLTAKIEELIQQLNEANKALNGMEEAIKKAKREAKKEAMEKTLQSMVRLCVVAPTVNVHFNQQQTSCKAPMPSNRIKAIIQNEVLPNFTSLFLQMEEGIAENGSRLDKWLEEMLAEMQASIQAHLHDVFSSDSGNTGGNSSSRPSSRSQSRGRPSSRSGYM